MKEGGKDEDKTDDTPDDGDDDDDKDEEESRKEYRAGNCNDCNRQFCLEYMNLPICKDKTLDEIFTTCFRKSYISDQILQSQQNCIC